MESLSHFQSLKNPDIQEVPLYLQENLAPWADVEYLKCENNAIMEQRFLNRYYSVFIYNFKIEEDVKLHLIFDKPTVAFQYNLKNSIYYDLRGSEKFDLATKECRLIYFPAGKDRIIFKKGEYEFIHFDISTEYVDILRERIKILRPYFIYIKYNTKRAHSQNASSCDELTDYLDKMRKFTDKGWDLRFRMEVLIFFLLEKYSELNSDQKYTA